MRDRGDGAGASWGEADVVSQFSTVGHTDPGESAALAAVDRERRGRVLDLGIGGGRTTGLLAGEASSYVGIDLAPEMVELARRRFPGVDLRVGDARDLDELPDLPDHSFDLVMWSFNGLDAVDHDERAGILASMARLVAEDGAVLFSCLNLDGVSFDERPWRLGSLTSARSRWQLASFARHPSTILRAQRNFQRTRPRSQDGAGWATRPLRAHEFRFVVHFATLEHLVGEVAAAGLRVAAAFDEKGRAVDPGAAHTDADYVHLVCRRAGDG